MKKILFILSILIIMFSFLIIAEHVITPTSFSVDEDVEFTYNITVTNTDTGADANITQVNITLPNGFTFVSGTNGSNANGTFTSTGDLSWVNSTILIDGDDTRSFWFNATASTPGNYNITVTTVNASGAFEKNISVTIEDTENPSISFVSPTPNSNSNLPQTYIPVNVTANDNVAIGTIIIYLYNSTSLIDSSSNSTSSFFVNFAGLSNGTYYINATVNDTSGNKDSTSTRTIILNLSSTSGCTPNWGNCTAWNSCVNENQTRTCQDLNLCNVITGNVRNETQTCTTDTGCTLDNWDCTEWEPLDSCPKNEERTRTCTLVGNCEGGVGKPEETRTCTFEGLSTTATVVIFIIVIIILVAGGVMFYIMKRKSFDEMTTPESSQGQPPNTSSYQNPQSSQRFY